MESWFVVVLLIGVFAGNVLSYPDQVPATDQVCRTMTPGHGPSPQKSASPYNLEVATANVRQGERVEVLLKGDSDFKGFYVQARSNGEPIGSFSPPNAQVKVHSCFGGKNNAIFHGSRGTRNNVAVTWKAPKDFTGQVEFLATFVKDFDIFWTQVSGGNVSVE